MSDAATSLLTEHFSYTPLSLIDDIINSINNLIYQAISSLETGLLNTPPERLGFSHAANASTIPDTDADGNIEYPEARVEIENGLHQLETLFESSVDRSFDKFEIYVLRNILTVPEDLVNYMKLGHYETLSFSNNNPNSPTPESINLQRKKLQETRKLQQALRRESAQNEAVIMQLRAILSAAQEAKPKQTDSQNTTAASLGLPSLGFLTSGPAADMLRVGQNQSLATNTDFVLSQLPALHTMTEKLREQLRSLPNTTPEGQNKRDERREYIDSRVRIHLERSGQPAFGDGNTAIPGRKIASTEAKALDKDLPDNTGQLPQYPALAEQLYNSAVLRRDANAAAFEQLWAEQQKPSLSTPDFALLRSDGVKSKLKSQEANFQQRLLFSFAVAGIPALISTRLVFVYLGNLVNAFILLPSDIDHVATGTRDQAATHAPSLHLVFQSKKKVRVREASTQKDVVVPADVSPEQAALQGAQSLLRQSSLQTSSTLEEPIPGSNSDGSSFMVQPARYIGRHSLEAFPRYLGLQLQSDLLPQMRPLVWNLQVREQPHCRVGDTLCSMVTLDMAKGYIRSFFAVDFPACGFLDFNALMDRTDKHFTGTSQGLPFEALVGGIIGLSSILTLTSNIQPEIHIVRHSESILTDQAILNNPSIDFLAALFFRSLYLRATATPHVTWLASCSAMHTVESLGLHKESGFDNYPGMWNSAACEKLFWMVCAGNKLISHELGRTPVILHGVTRKFPPAYRDASNPAAILTHLGCFLPLTDGTAGSESDVEYLTDLFEAVKAHRKQEHPYLTLFTADVCFCLHRRIRVNNEVNIIQRAQSQQIVSIGKAAVRAATVLAQKGQAWWNMLSTLFQFCCVLISMDSVDALSDLHYTIQTINLIKDRYPSRTISEAFSVLQLLVRAMKQKKEKEVSYLHILEDLEPPPRASSVALPAVEVTQIPTAGNSEDFTFDFRAWCPEDLDWVFATAPPVR
ncbi:Protein RDR1 [Talaromyces islandicus]|uniref:Protein RDR1 n=1 Tax=Talaromyces islandicus TaxID=28573 RepID=A0A0U1M101_TALIS|nr:Protein RDR1 [Talaromyces islandicus]